jgi:NagD protein
MPDLRAFVFDLDGTIYLGERVIPGAPEVIAELRQWGCGVVFLSNKPLEQRHVYAQKLETLGIPASVDQVINSSLAMTRYLVREMPGATVFAIGEQPLLDELAAAGFPLSEDPHEIDVVIASFDRTFDYRKLDIGFRALRSGARFFATNADRTCPIEGGELPDAAAVIGALEGCSGRELELVVGKPSSVILELALEQLGVPAEQCLMVGDRLETDILMGNQAGMATAVVLTGVTQRQDIAAAPASPDYVLDSVADLLHHVSCIGDQR